MAMLPMRMHHGGWRGGQASWWVADYAPTVLIPQKRNWLAPLNQIALMWPQALLSISTSTLPLLPLPTSQALPSSARLSMGLVEQMEREARILADRLGVLHLEYTQAPYDLTVIYDQVTDTLTLPNLPCWPRSCNWQAFFLGLAAAGMGHPARQPMGGRPRGVSALQAEISNNLAMHMTATSLSVCAGARDDVHYLPDLPERQAAADELTAPITFQDALNQANRLTSWLYAQLWSTAI